VADKEVKLWQHKTNDKKPTAEDRVGALVLQTFPDVHTIDERASVSLYNRYHDYNALKHEGQPVDSFLLILSSTK